jgi:hypothetical protein
MDRVFLIGNQIQKVSGKILVPLMTSNQAVEKRLVLSRHGEKSLFTSHHSCAYVLGVPFKRMHTVLDWFLDRLHRCADRLWSGRHFGTRREGIPMNQCLSRCSSLDLSQTGKVTSLEATLAMFEFPQRRVGRCRVKDVAHFSEVSAMRQFWTSTSIIYLCESHTY